MSFVLHQQYALPEYCDDIYVQDGQVFAVVPAVVACQITDQNIDVIIHFYDYLGWKVLPQVITDVQGFYWLVKDKYNSSCNVFKVGLAIQKNVLLQQQDGNQILYRGAKEIIPIDNFRQKIDVLQKRRAQAAISDDAFQTMLQTKSSEDLVTLPVNSQPCPWFEEAQEEEGEPSH